MTPDMIKWVRAQIDDEERMARAATQGAWKLWGMDVLADRDGTSNVNTAQMVAYTRHESGLLTFNAQHIATWDPARVLAEVEAKRRILDEHGPDELRPWECRACAGPHGDDGYHIPCPTVRLVALPYADRDGYRDEWRP